MIQLRQGGEPVAPIRRQRVGVRRVGDQRRRCGGREQPPPPLAVRAVDQLGQRPGSSSSRAAAATAPAAHRRV